MKSVCIVPASPLRKEASHRTEMVSQLLFGEHCEVLEEVTDWKKVRCDYDGYEGWCQESHVHKYDIQAPHHLQLSYRFFEELSFNGNKMQIGLGSDLSLISNGELQIGKHKVGFQGKVWAQQQPHPDLIRAIAMEYINVPYLWGGRSVFGIDCSGFCQAIYKFFGIKLLRDAYQQATQGEVVGFIQEAKTGDLAFFDNDEGRITHVGMLLSPETIIHSSGKVRIDHLDHQGIINLDSGKRTHKLRIIKRYF